MKTQLAKPARTKASYTDQYKQEALEVWRNSGRSASQGSGECGRNNSEENHDRSAHRA